jgi:MraZ protein
MGGAGVTSEYQHTVDAKGRLFIPAKLRDELGVPFHICKGLDNSLSVYSQEAWSKIRDKLDAMPQRESRKLRLELFPFAQKGEPDAQGRVLLSETLRTHAGIDQDRNVTVIGLGDHAEIWLTSRWIKETEAFTDESFEEAIYQLL